MKAIILCAGQGRRLLPHTESTPKCLIPLQNKPFIEWQIDALSSVGVDEIIAVVGYSAQRVTSLLNKRYGDRVSTVYNPFYEIADNLASCWIAREHFHDDFILMNGDTLFEPAIASELINTQHYPIVLASDQKDAYDDDDMKIITSNSQLHQVGKKLPAENVNGESIGMMRFNPEGAALFKAKLEAAMFDPTALKKWYLSLINELAQENQVGICPIKSKEWTELDFVQDLEHAQKLAIKWSNAQTNN